MFVFVVFTDCKTGTRYAVFWYCLNVHYICYRNLYSKSCQFAEQELSVFDSSFQQLAKYKVDNLFATICCC